MDRFLLVCLLLLAVLCASGIVGFAVAPLLSSPEDRAISVALAEPGVQDFIATDPGHYVIDNVALQGQNGKSGFIDIEEEVYAVNLSKPNMIFGVDRYIAFVNLRQSKVIGSEWYSYRGFPASLDITLPPGASYYHVLFGMINGGPSNSEDFGVQTFWYRIGGLSPENASLYPILVDEPNLSKLKNGSSYEAAVYNDTWTHQPAVMNGTAPVCYDWSVNASVKRLPRYDTGNWPDFYFSPSYYLVLRNAGPEAVNFSIGMW